MALTTRDATLPAVYSQACLFQFNDQPALRALGLLQEETRG